MKFTQITDKSTKLQYICKTTTGVSLNREATSTDYPTTEGAAISDHIYNNPDSLSMNLYVSELYTGDNFVEYNPSTGTYRALTKEQVQLLVDGWYVYHNRLLITTRNYSKQKQLDNMVLMSITSTAGNSNKGLWSPSLTFKQMRIATLRTVIIDFPNNSKTYINNSGGGDAGQDNGFTWEGAASTAGAGALVGISVGKTIGTIVGLFAGSPGAGRAIGAAAGAAVGAVGGFLVYLTGSD